MHKTKRGPALFEVLNKDPGQASETLQVPPWGSRRGGPLGDDAIKLAPRPLSEPSKTADRPRMDAPGEPVRFAELIGGRIRVSFSSTAAAIAVFVGMAIVLAAFELGSRSGYHDGLRVGHEAGRTSYAAEAVSEIEMARSQPAATHLVRSLLADEGAAAPDEIGDGTIADPKETTWIRGYTYIVAQEFAADHEEDARHAQRYLGEKGVATAAVTLPGGAIQLITSEGYNHKDPTQKRIAEQLLEKVHRIGVLYYSGGGGYRLEGYFKTLRGENW